jgi:hypothetical protein
MNWTFSAARKMLILAASVLALSTASGACRAENWRYTNRDAWNNVRVGDYFDNVGNGTWIEVIGGTTRWQYQEVERTATFIRLYDASRAVRIDLYSNASYIEYPDSRGFIYLAPGVLQP